MKIFLLPVMVLLLSQCSSENKAGAPPPPMPVKVANPVKKVIGITETYTGRFTPVEEVVLQARVSGYLESVHFSEGQEVKKGDLMFSIDPRVFDATKARAEAVKKQAVARLALAESILKRAKKLVQKNAVSQEEFDSRANEVMQAEADILVAEAGIRTANLDREFSEIKAPISGIAGRFKVTVGNFISGGAANATLLTTIVPHDPIYCSFEVDERRVLQLTRLFFEGNAGGRDGKRTEVEIAVSDRDAFEFKGVVNFVENQLDRQTATLQIRASVENDDKFLTPGLFARVRVPIGKPVERLLVKDAALGFDQDKRFAWVMKADNTVEKRYVETGQLEGKLRIIKGGLEEEEKIAISGIQLLRPGMPFAPTTVPMIAE